MFLACEKVNSTVEESIQETENLISQQKALEMVISQMAFFDNSGNSATKNKNYELLNFAIIPPLTKSESNSPLYLFNFKDNSGYAIISADKRDHNRIYLVSTEGYIDVNILNDKYSPYNLIYQCINKCQALAISNYEENFTTKAKEEEVIVTTTVSTYGPYLSTRWVQGYPFNQTLRESKGFPINCYVGCAPVAIGQILAHDTTINSMSYLSNSNNVINFNMNNIRSILSQYDAEEDYNTNGGILAKQVSDFLYYIGEAIQTEYTYNNEKGYYEGKSRPVDFADGLERFGYTCTALTEYDLETVKGYLHSNTPVLINGYSNNTSTDNHTWIIDGHKTILEEHRTYDENGNLLENNELNDYNFNVTNTYLHCNFGWENRKANGDYHTARILEVQGWPTRTYINSDIFKSSNMYYPENPNESGNFEYIDLRIMSNIRQN